MNDFTKEELEKICQFFNIAIEDFHEPDSTYGLRDKIQFMIDNYCDHRYVIPNFSIVQECSECKKYVTHDLCSNMKKNDNSEK